MTQSSTIHTDPCPGCNQADGTYWLTSTPESELWACRHCGTEWTITVHLPGQ